MKRIVCGGRCVDVQQFILMMTNAISQAAPFSRLQILKSTRTVSHKYIHYRMMNCMNYGGNAEKNINCEFNVQQKFRLFFVCILDKKEILKFLTKQTQFD